VTFQNNDFVQHKAGQQTTPVGEDAGATQQHSANTARTHTRACARAFRLPFIRLASVSLDIFVLILEYSSKFCISLYLSSSISSSVFSAGVACCSPLCSAAIIATAAACDAAAAAAFSAFSAAASILTSLAANHEEERRRSARWLMSVRVWSAQSVRKTRRPCESH